MANGLEGRIIKPCILDILLFVIHIPSDKTRNKTRLMLFLCDNHQALEGGGVPRPSWFDCVCVFPYMHPYLQKKYVHIWRNYIKKRGNTIFSHTGEFSKKVLMISDQCNKQLNRYQPTPFRLSPHPIFYPCCFDHTKHACSFHTLVLFDEVEGGGTRVIVYTCIVLVIVIIINIPKVINVVLSTSLPSSSTSLRWLISSSPHHCQHHQHP